MVKVYRRIEDRADYRNITEVDSAGNYSQRNVYGAGRERVLNEFHTTLAAMGWGSLAEFLKGRKRFVPAE